LTRILFVVVGTAAAGLTMAGCGKSDSSSAPQAAHTSEVAMTDAGCEPARISVTAGPRTFHVTNKGAQSVHEFEVAQGGHVLAESENLADGDDRSFSLTLEKGSYDLLCPGGATASRGTLTVTGSGGTAKLSAAQQAAVNRYRDYIETKAASLVGRTAVFADAVRAGDVDRAKELFAGTREPYEAIEPVAESFGDLDPEIDARINDVDGGFAKWTGFHRLEWALWKRGSLDAKDRKLADKLASDVKALESKVKTVDLEPAQIVNGSNELLGEVAKSKITGEEDRYSHTDLWDFDSNLAGAREGFSSAQPLLDKSDPELSRTIQQRFAAAQKALDRYRRGPGWVIYTKLSKADTRALAQAIDALAEPLSEAPGKLVHG
jgi:iron uptake system component EfeO